MKFNKIAKKFAAAALAGVLAVSSMGLSVSAATGRTDGTESIPVTTVNFTKYVLTDGDTYAPNTTFTFTVSPAAAGTDNEGNTTKAGVEGGLVVSEDTNISFAPDTTSDTSDSYSKSGTLSVDASKFTSEGIYHYTMTEDAVTYEGITKDSTVYDIYVHVYNTTDMTGYYVAYVTVVKTVNGVATKSDLVFNNDYGQDNDTTHDVTVTKKITGTAANTSDTFSFTVSVSGETEEAYKIVYTQSGEEATTSVVSGSSVTLTGIGQNDTITIYGLTENDTYTVEEVNAGTYTATNSQNSNEEGKVSGKVTEDETSETITNTKNYETPTGIALSIAPYVLMVAFAGVIAVLFLRKRNYEI